MKEGRRDCTCVMIQESQLSLARLAVGVWLAPPTGVTPPKLLVGTPDKCIENWLQSSVSCEGEGGGGGGGVGVHEQLSIGPSQQRGLGLHLTCRLRVLRAGRVLQAWVWFSMILRISLTSV